MIKYPVVLVTGCGSGIGYEIAKELYLSKKFRVIITARDPKSIRRLKFEMPENSQFKISKLDITKPKERESLIAEILHTWKSLDILINNAGVSYRSVIEHMDDESEMHQLNVNYLAPMALIRLVVPPMRENGRGKIINISSVSGFVSMPTMSSYAASKHALEGATEALWYELKPYGIEVSLIQPGFICSKSFEKVYYSKKAELSKDIDGPYSEYYQYMTSFVERLMLNSLTTPEKVAKKIMKLISAPNSRLWIPVTLDAVLFYLLRKLMPRSLFHRLMYSFLPQVRMWGVRGYHKAISEEQIGNRDFLRSQYKQKNQKSSGGDEPHDYQQSDL